MTLLAIFANLSDSLGEDGYEDREGIEGIDSDSAYG
jgi:hypothetical protein